MPHSTNASPMMAQYHEIKRAHPDSLLFFRMGDFYELFFDDAVKAAPALDIALTKRGRHDDDDVPMCGVPVVSSENYLHKLISKGFRVAICEQLEDPAEAKKRGGKPLVARGVVRVVTPGTLTEDVLLDARTHNHLLAVAWVGGGIGLAWVDVSTSTFETQSPKPGDLAGELERIQPGEILFDPRLLDQPEQARSVEDWRHLEAPAQTIAFDTARAEHRLQQFFELSTLEGLGSFDRAEIAAAGAILDYLDLTQKGKLPRLERPVRFDRNQALQIDAATRRNLEILTSQYGDPKGGLLAAIDQTTTHPGARLLAQHLAAPLTSKAQIDQRLDQVEAFFLDDGLRAVNQRLLKGCPDAERALSRVNLERAGPRDIANIGQAMAVAGTIKRQLHDREPVLQALSGSLDPPLELAEQIARTLEDQPPPTLKDGGFVRASFDAALDELRNLRDHSRDLIVGLEAEYRSSTGINNLKIKHNNMLGYFVEVTALHRDRVPVGFVQRQGMANATRYMTERLQELGAAIASAGDKALAHELALFRELTQAVRAQSDSIADTAQKLAGIDVTLSHAEVAQDQRYVRPQLNDGSGLRIDGGRHPVVEQSRRDEAVDFTPNDCHLSDDGGKLWLLTGPNMAGKSTFLRQNALIVLMAQSGSFVPAARAEIGLVDRLFSRVGAADDLARGRSTFMVEMVETAGILNAATPKSLVILDEIGRGTATFDGLSIALAVLEHLHDTNRCRALFATHYHELTSLRSRLKSMSCHQMRVKEWRGQIVFLHEVGQGSADRSYGIHVAKLAGLPASVIKKANQVLKKLEQGQHPGGQKLDDLPLFQEQSGPDSVAHIQTSEIERRVASIDADMLTPKQSLELIYELKALLPKTDDR